MLQMIDFFANVEVHKKYPNETHILKSKIDETLCSTFTKMKRESPKFRIKQFMAAHGRKAALIMNLEHYRKCAEVQKDFINVAPELQALCAETSLGKRMFGGCLERLQNEMVTKTITDKLEEVSPNSRTNRAKGSGDSQDSLSLIHI